MKTIKNRKLKGSVLLTVVSVMALLIIFLFGTLTLATAANNRAHVNYSSAQTNITARTVVKTAYDAMGEDQAYADSITALSDTNRSIDIPVALSSSSTNVNTLGHIESLTAEYAGKRQFYDSTKKSWKECDLVRLTATATLNGVSNSSSLYIVKDPPSPPPTGGGGGAGFVTTGAAGFGVQSSAYGGTYLNLPTKENAAKIDYLTHYDTYGVNYYDENESFTFNQSDTLIEADSVFNGDFTTGMLTHILYPGKGTGFTVWGDLKFWHKDGKINAFDQLSDVTSNLTLTSAANIKFNEMPYMYVDQTISGPAKLGPHASGNLLDSVGSGKFPFNTFAGNIDIDTAFALGGDLYLMNAAQENTINLDSRDGTLYEWTATIINKTGDTAVSKAQGNIYCKGKMNIKGSKPLTLQGLYCEKGVDFSNTGSITINGDLVVNGGITGSSTVKVKGNVYADSISGVTLKNASDLTIDTDSITSYSGTIYPDYAERDVLLGLKQLGSIPVEETQVVRRMEQVLENVINPYDSDQMKPAMMQKLTELEGNADKHFASRDAAKAKPAVSGFTWCTSYWDSTNNCVKLTYNDGADNNSGVPVIRQSCVLTGTMDCDTDLSGPYTGDRLIVFDPGPDEMLVVIDGYTSSHDFLINDMEGGTVYFYIKSGSTLNIEKNLITTKYLNVLGKIAKGADIDTLNMEDTQKSFQVFTDPSYAIAYSSKTDPVPFTEDCLRLSIPASEGKYAPGCKIYGESGSKLTFNKCALMTAQVISPNIEFSAATVTGNLLDSVDFYYNGRKPKVSGRANILGCLNCGEANLGKDQVVNVFYIPDKTDPKDPIGVPDHTHDFSILYYDEY